MLPRTPTAWATLLLAGFGFFVVLDPVQAQQRKASPSSTGLKAGKQKADTRGAKAHKGGRRQAGGSPLMNSIHQVFGLLDRAVQKNMPGTTINYLNQALHHLLLDLTGGHRHHHRHHGHGMHGRAKHAHKGHGAHAGHVKRRGSGKGATGSVRNAGPRNHGPGARLGQNGLARNAGKAKTNAHPDFLVRSMAGRGAALKKGTGHNRSPFQRALQSTGRHCVSVGDTGGPSREKHKGNAKRGGQDQAKGGQNARAKQTKQNTNQSRGNAKNAGKATARFCFARDAGNQKGPNQRTNLGNVRGVSNKSKKSGGQAKAPGARLGQNTLAKSPGACKNGPGRNARLGSQVKGAGQQAGNRAGGLAKCQGKFASQNAPKGNHANAKRNGSAKGSAQVGANFKLKGPAARTTNNQGASRGVAKSNSRPQQFKNGNNQATGFKKGGAQKSNLAAQQQKMNRPTANRSTNMQKAGPRQFSPVLAKGPQQQMMNRPQPRTTQRPMAFQRGMAQAGNTGRRR